MLSYVHELSYKPMMCFSPSSPLTPNWISLHEGSLLFISRISEADISKFNKRSLNAITKLEYCERKINIALYHEKIRMRSNHVSG